LGANRIRRFYWIPKRMSRMKFSCKNYFKILVANNDNYALAA